MFLFPLFRLAPALHRLALLALTVSLVHTLTGCDSSSSSGCGGDSDDPALEICLPGGAGAAGASAAGAGGASDAPVCASASDTRQALDYAYQIDAEAQVKGSLCCYPARRIHLCD